MVGLWPAGRDDTGDALEPASLQLVFELADLVAPQGEPGFGVHLHVQIVDTQLAGEACRRNERGRKVRQRRTGPREQALDGSRVAHAWTDSPRLSATA